MKRDDFIFTIGYAGGTAIVDRDARKRHGGKGAGELLDAGLYRAAFCAALYDGEVEAFVERYRAASGDNQATAETLKRQFGVFDVADDGTSVSAIG